MKINLIYCLLVVLSFSALPSLSYAEDVITLRSTVKGNQEQPKVIYILPWQKADKVEWNYTPEAAIINDVIRAVDYDEFVRQIAYKESINERAANVNLSNP